MANTSILAAFERMWQHVSNKLASSLEEAKSYSDDNLDAANVYTDSAVSQKSQVQIVTPEATEILSTLKLHRLTQEEYDEKVASGEIDENALYLTPSEEIDLSNYATTEQLNDKADVNHNHDDVYYTEIEVDELLANKAEATHNHDSLYDSLGSSEDALASAKEYSDTNLENAKLYSDAGDSAVLEESKTYTDNEVAQKTQVQIIASDVSEALSTLKIHKLTQEEYEQKVEAGTIDENALYLTPDEVIDLSGYATKEYVDSKTVGEHNHDDLYYTETEVDIKISDLNTSISSSLEEAKSYSNSNLEIAKTYTDNAVVQKSLIQIVTWEADD